MSLTALIIGIFLQVMFAVFQFMVVVFVGGGAANGTPLKPWQMDVLNTSLFLIPSVSILVSLILIFLYRSNSPYLSNWWHIVPLAVLALYIIFVLSLDTK